MGRKKTKASKNAYMTKGEKALLKLYEAQEDARGQTSHKDYRTGKK